MFMIGKPKNSQRGIRRSISVRFIHKHHLVVGVWKSSTKKFFIETKYLCTRGNLYLNVMWSKPSHFYNKTFS